MKDPYPGQECVVVGDGDLYMDAAARPFINNVCVVIKITNSGLVRVALKTSPRQIYNVPKRNLRYD